MDTMTFSAWMKKIEERMLAFLSEPSDENEAALLLMMTEYREAVQVEYTDCSSSQIS